MYAYATLYAMMSKATEPGQEGSEPVTKMVRLTLTAEEWRRLRIKAAEQDESMTRLLGAILAREAGRGGDS
jgi:hypothetical protein